MPGGAVVAWRRQQARSTSWSVPTLGTLIGWTRGRRAPWTRQSVKRARRIDNSVSADPQVTDYTGHLRYFSPGQREAVRAAFLMPAGSAVVINLPTGAGEDAGVSTPSSCLGIGRRASGRGCANRGPRKRSGAAL